MSLTVGELVAYLKLDDKEYNEKVDRAGEKFTGLGGTVKGVASTIAGSAIAQQVTGFFSGAISGASDLRESLSKSSVVFGDSASAVEDFASRASTSMGQSKQQALEAAGTFGNLMVSLGIGQKPAADMSMSLVQLASDLASFNNVPVDVALEALRSGLTGETEPLKKFGVNLNDATLKAKAMEMGLSDGKGTLDANAKAQAAYALIIGQTGTAQGDFARTSDGLANSQRTLTAKMGDLKSTLGSALLPIIEKVVGFVSKLLGFFTSLPAPVQQAIGIIAGLAAGLAGVAMVIGPIMSALPVLGALFGALTGPVGLVAAAIAAVIAIGVLLYKHWDDVKRIAGVVWNAIKDAIVTAWNAVVDALKAAATFLYDALVKPYVDAWKWVYENIVLPIANFLTVTVIPAVTGAWDAVKEAVTHAFKAAWEWIGTNVVTPIANFFKDTVIPALEAVWNTVYEWVVKPYVEGWKWVYNNVVLPIARFFTDTVVPAFQSAYDAVKGAITGAFSAAWQWLQDNVVNPIKNFWTDTVVPAFTDAYEAVKNAIVAPFKAAWEWIDKNLIQPVKGFFSWLAEQKTVPGITDGRMPSNGSNIIDYNPVGGFAAGGIFPAVPGGRIIRVAEGGEAEAVIPLSKLNRIVNNNQRQYTFNVTGNNGLEIGRQVLALLGTV